MQLKIFVVTTKLREIDKTRLEIVQTDLTKLFSGLTIIPNCSGLWLNDNKQIEKDLVEIWLIYTTQDNYLKSKSKFQKLLNEIKDITQQTTQACTIDTKIYFL